ncbi:MULTISPECIES: phosphate ABC transporter permease PstA [Halorussus]|uniref:phosphate ABC transporter permease PstA n=1 Tax=Halorussus TaxID=1070314 RepID=UPI000E2148A4|nr:MULTISPECIES: phosphate ABC transporter permease PstA [Halorussus]NHN59686.1 phosphate ABC transporter permease PstA [Halorussus sp. JP-T4]
MSYETGTLVADESTLAERVASGVVGLNVLSVILGVAAIFQWTEVGSEFLGVTLFDLYGASLVLAGAGVVALGLASRADLFDTTPDRSAGLLTGGLFGLVGVVAGGLFASQTLGLGAVGWVPAALLVGVGVAAATVVPREDVGSTLPAGALSVLVGGLLLLDVITPGWEWAPQGFSATFTGPVTGPVLTIFAGLVCAWAAAKAYEGFGTRGRQAGAYLLVGMNAFAMLGVLLLLILFVAGKGWSRMVEGVKFGLFTEPAFWFHAPVLDEWVIFEIPGVWFYWPFTMNGYSLSQDVMNGVLPSIVGTVWLVVGAVLFAVPLGVGAAVFLTEYAEQGGFTRVVEIATNGLWSTPSIVYGLFGYAFLVPRLGNTTSLLAGQLVLGFMLLPLVLITSREAIMTVPDEYRDASAALGVSQWETIKSVVVPAAMPGVITGVILGVGRIAGETAPILLVATGNLRASGGPQVLSSFQFTASPPFVANPALLNSITALPYKLYATITAGVVSSDPAFGWATALVLLVVVLSFYAVGIASRIYFRRKLEQ